MSKGILLYGPDVHHLDHLAPLCDLLSIPLIVTEEQIASLARTYYPMVEVILCDYLTAPEMIVENFSHLFYSMPRALFDEVFFFAEQWLRKKVQTIWCPHGNSDKGSNTFFMEALREEKKALLYGEKMVNFLKEKHAFDQLKAHVITGNLRYTFFKRHQNFYRELLSPFKKASKTLLYAPTWQDYEKSSSFYDAIPHLIQNLPEDWNLIIKLHPNLKEEAIEHPRIFNVSDFPPIYPLLERVDAYIGDMSSIGYDFLTFDKPLFFLNQNKRDPKTDAGLYLFRCGKQIEKEDYPHIYKMIKESRADDFSKVRKEVYHYTFGEEKGWDLLKEEVKQLYN